MLGMAALMLTAVAPSATATLLGVDFGGGTLWNVNTTTGTTTSIAATGLTTLDGIAFSPGGTLWGLNQANLGLYTINQSTGASNFVTTVTGLNALIEGDIAFSSSGTLYAVYDVLASGAEDLFSINTSTGMATDIGAIIPFVIAGNDLSAMAFDASGNLWVYDDDALKLYTVNTSTGAILTSVNVTVNGMSQFTGSVAGMSFNPANGTLYLATGEGTTNLYTVNTTTGALSLVGSTGENISGLAFTPAVGGTPEPAAFGFVLAGACIMAAFRRFAQ